MLEINEGSAIIQSFSSTDEEVVNPGDTNFHDEMQRDYQTEDKYVKKTLNFYKKNSDISNQRIQTGTSARELDPLIHNSLLGDLIDRYSLYNSSDSDLNAQKFIRLFGFGSSANLYLSQLYDVSPEEGVKNDSINGPHSKVPGVIIDNNIFSNNTSKMFLVNNASQLNFSSLFIQINGGNRFSRIIGLSGDENINTQNNIKNILNNTKNYELVKITVNAGVEELTIRIRDFTEKYVSRNSIFPFLEKYGVFYKSPNNVVNNVYFNGIKVSIND